MLSEQTYPEPPMACPYGMDLSATTHGIACGINLSPTTHSLAMWHHCCLAWPYLQPSMAWPCGIIATWHSCISNHPRLGHVASLLFGMGISPTTHGLAMWHHCYLAWPYLQPSMAWPCGIITVWHGCISNHPWLSHVASLLLGMAVSPTTHGLSMWHHCHLA